MRKYRYNIDILEQTNSMIVNLDFPKLMEADRLNHLLKTGL